MTATEIFEKLAPQRASDIFTYLHDEERAAYKATMLHLTSRKKLRPVFLEKKQKHERHLWMAENLAKKRNEDLAIEILQTWVLKTQTPAILQFLEDLGISHDGSGLIEDTPSEPAPETVKKGVENLLAKFPHDCVAIYLHLFIQMDPDGWKTLRQLLEETPELQLSAPAQSPSPESQPEKTEPEITSPTSTAL